MDQEMEASLRNEYKRSASCWVNSDFKLERELQDRERELSQRSRTDRNLEREIKSLEYELAQKEKVRARLEQDLQRSDEKNVKLKIVVDEMMSENTTPTKLGRFASTRSGK
jgi:septal ring factor EnvC (AmiA/AmiB activator)